MTTLIFISIGLAALFLIMLGSATGMFFLQSKKSGWRLLLLVPIPGAMAIGICTATYLLSYASDKVAVALFAALSMIAAWLVGVLFCLLAAGIKKVRSVQ